jgi:hypothetical protein
MAAYPFHYWLRLSSPVSLVVASKLALLFSIYGFLLLLRNQTTSTTERFLAGSLVAFNPYIIYGHAGYSEPLYFAFLAFAFYVASRQWWIISGLMGGLLSATRMVGFLFSVPYTMMSLGGNSWRGWWRKIDSTKLIGLLLCPLGTAFYMLYLYRRTGDALAQVHIHIAWVGTQFSNPLQALWVPLHKHHWPRVWAGMAITGLLASVWLVKLRKSELGIYLGLSIVVALLGGSRAGDLYGMPRYIWWQPPFLYAIYIGLKRYSAWWPVYLAFSSGIAAFVIIGWFTGHNFVV